MTTTNRILLVGLLLGGLIALALGPFANSSQAATFTVTSKGDFAGYCPPTPPLGNRCTLRTAIMEVNAQPTGTGPHRINFSIGIGNQTIDVNSTGLGALPTITQPVFIDGQSQRRLCGGLTSLGTGCQRVEPCVVPCIVVSGYYVPGPPAGPAGPAGLLTIGSGSSGSTIRNLVINQFNQNSGIRVEGNDNVIQGNYIGTDLTGNASPPYQKMKTGVFLSATGSGTVVSGNVISGNGNGIVIDATGLNDPYGLIAKRTLHHVLGNYIGTNAAGTTILGNESYGVLIKNASANLVDGGNVIGGNDIGVYITSSQTTYPATSNEVHGNFIGTDKNAAADLQNRHDGVTLDGPVRDTKIGTVKGNYVSRNLVRGIKIAYGTTANEIRNNTSLQNVVRDMEDGNDTVDPCANEWMSNVFTIQYDASGGGCIQ